MLAAAATLLVGCSEPEPVPRDAAPMDSDGPRGSDGGDPGCHLPAATPVDDAVQSPACAAWIQAVMPRAVAHRGGSGAIWTRRGASGHALMISAAHLVGTGIFGPESQPLAPYLGAPWALVPAAAVRVPGPDGTLPEGYNGDFLLYQPGIPAEQNRDGLRHIEPAHDFMISVVDDELYASDRGEIRGSLGEPLAAAPGGDDGSSSPPTYREATAGEAVLILGFPQTAGETLHAITGRVLSESSATAAVQSLAAVGDEEGLLAYRHAVEMFVDAAAEAGISGSGVFGTDGVLVGTAVRGTVTPTEGRRYVRAVRATHIVREFARELAEASEEDRAAVAPFVEPELLP